MTISDKRHLLAAAPVDVLKDLPKLGRVMVIVRSAGSLHERIGPVETATVERETVHLGGACHAVVIHLPGLGDVHYDTSSVMKDKVYPRLDFMTAAGEPAVSVVGMDGDALFEATFRALAGTPVEAPARPAPEATPPETEGDPAGPVLAALAGAAPVTIRFETDLVCQHWQGSVEAIRPSSGFFNIMTPDFHLHLKAGTLVSWQEENGWRHAVGTDGLRTGLAIGPAAASSEGQMP